MTDKEIIEKVLKEYPSVHNDKLHERMIQKALSLKEQETEARILREVIKLGDKWEIAEESPIKSGEFEYVLFKESALFKELTSKIKEEKESEEK